MAARTRSARQSDTAEHFSRSHDAVIRAYDAAHNVTETLEHKGDFKELVIAALFEAHQVTLCSPFSASGDTAGGRSGSNGKRGDCVMSFITLPQSGSIIDLDSVAFVIR